jgi:hypothetical protein
MLPEDSISSENPPTMSSPIDNHEKSSVTNASSLAPVPILCCVDKPSSSLPSRLILTEDFIHSSVGYRRIDTMTQFLPQLYQDTIKIDSSPPDAIHDMGEFATLPKQPRNTTPVVQPTHFGDVIHMDIIFGPEVALGNVHYVLLFTDRHSRMTYMYPLQNLTTDIVRQLETFFAHIGFSPKRLISDFDTKLKAREYLNSLKIHVNAAPWMRQDKNGLAERHWQTLTAMARNWLVSAELPSTFWFFAVKRAAEISNYFPLKLENGSWSTPIQLSHFIQPDLRVLFKLFSVASVRRERVGDCQLGKFDSQSTLMIAVGHCRHSNSIQFYNPVNGTFVSSIDYKFQTNVTAGSQFGYKYQSGIFLYWLDESTHIFAPRYNLDTDVYVHAHSPPLLAKVIGIPTYKSPNFYTIVYPDGSISEYTNDLLSAAPSTSSPVSSLPSWIKGGANAILFLHHMPKPRHGKLQQLDGHFSLGKPLAILFHFPISHVTAMIY